MRSIGILFLLLGLIGCGGVGGGGEPSNADITEAYQKILDQTYEQMVSVGGQEAADRMRPKLYSIEKIACTKATDAAGYQCDITVDQETGVVGRMKTNGSLRFVDGDDGWVAIQPSPGY